MASTLRAPTIPNQTHKTTLSSTSASTTAISSSFVKRVCLSKWWLIETETANTNCKGLGVGGFAFREGQGIRVFRSEAISKRHDTDTIETVNGITINLIGFIDEPRTRKNGFPFKVCDPFRFGFPYDWEEYAARYCDEESNKDDTRSGVSTLGGTNNSRLNLNNPLPTSFDDIPVAQVRDLLMSPTEDSEYRAISRVIFNDILRKCGDNSSKHSGPTIHSNDENEDETPRDHRHSIRDDDNCISNEKTTRRKKSEKLDDVQSNKKGSRPGVATRSMRKREFEKTLSSASSSAAACGVGEPFSERPEACSLATTGASNASDVVVAADLLGEMGIMGNHNKSGAKKYRKKDLAEFSGPQVVLGKESGRKIGPNGGEETEVVEKFAESAVRRSRRLKNLSKC